MAITAKDLNIGYAYNITIKPKLASYFANRYNNIVVVGMVDYGEACKVTDIPTLMANINIAENQDLDPRIVTYIKFKSETSNEFIIPMNVIETATPVKLITFRVSISNATNEDADLILNQIHRLGYTDAVVQKVEAK